MISLPAKIIHLQIEPDSRFSGRAEVVVPEKIVYVELYNLPSGVNATNLSDVAPTTQELLISGDGEPPFKVGDTLSARGFTRDELPD
jgi:hypothetical protein